MQKSTDQIPLWRQLQATAGVIAAVNHGVSGTAAIDSVNALLRPGVQALAFQVWRNFGRAQVLRSKLAAKKPPPEVDALLCIALALAWDETNASYDVFTLVNQAVEAAKRSPHTKAQANFLNACLRRFLRERDAMVQQSNGDPVAKWNFPRWWVDRLKKDYPQGWEAILTDSNIQPPLTIRVNAKQSTSSHYLDELRLTGVDGFLNGAYGIDLSIAVPVQKLPGFGEGSISVQDGAAQLAAPLLLEYLKGQSHPVLLDACAAPGGKTGHLLELSNARVVALDIDALRCRRVSENLARLGERATVQAGDASDPSTWWDGVMFDGILLDAPCTASGITRRHPDVRWLRRESDVEQLATLQAKILQALWPLLKPGGVMLYCTCSVFRSEGDGQVQTFLAHNTDANLLPSPGHLTPRNGAKSSPVPDNQSRDHDGFFYALFQKRIGQ
jgi:16S rRNA (cytosine967-C5)-methyltransferase